MKNFEEFFVAEFVDKNSRERIAYELASVKRAAALSKFAHSASLYLNKKSVVWQGDNATKNDIIKHIYGQTGRNSLFLKSHFAYVISQNEAFDEKQFSADAAIEMCLKDSLLCILVFDNGAALLKEEFEKNGATIYFLKNAE